MVFGPCVSNPLVLKTNLDLYDAYIVVSFVNATLVLSVNEDGVEEVTDSGFLGTSPSLLVAQVGEDSLLQVYPHGIRHIKHDKRISEWKVPSGHIISKAANNNRQVAIALSSGHLVYFEIDTFGNLNEFQDRKEMATPITSLGLGPVPSGRTRTKFLAVGCEDSTLRIFSLDPSSCLDPIGVQSLPSIPESVTITRIKESKTYDSGLFMHVGLSNGVLMRSVVDDVTGALSDARMRFAGTKSVGLYNIRVGNISKTDNENAVLVTCSRPWLAYSHLGTLKLVPLSYFYINIVTIM